MHHQLPNEETIKKQQISPHCYIIGSVVLSTLTIEQRRAIQIEQDTYHIFFRLYKEGIIYHSTCYVKNHILKRENSICRFFGTDNSLKYGQINIFVADQSPVALVTVFTNSDTSLMASAGNPCRPQLCAYKK